MGERLTDKLVRALEPPPLKDGKARNVITYDDNLPGFGARITSAGAKSFVFNYRRKSDGRERRATIGQFPAWSAATARQRAAELRRAVDNGGDPVGELAAERGAPTVAELCARFVEEHLPRVRPATRQLYGSAVANEIMPALGDLKVAAVEYAHIDRLHAKITKRAPYMANRVVAVLSTMFALAVRWKWRPDSPVRGFKRNQEPKRRRYLSDDELTRLTAALEARPSQAANVVWLLLLTGARKGEVLGATWDQFDLEKGLWRKPAATTKQKTEHEVPLNLQARRLLAQMRKQSKPDSRYVFPGSGPRGHRSSLRKDWALLCKDAGITGLRVHDIRHSYASLAAGTGSSLPIIGALLGHASPATTHRYAHLAHSPLREATERVGAIVAGVPSAKVMPLKGTRR